ncbi:MAG TPA: universal stress protein [Candidatus Binatia bacterium]|nr:universal stress protein [Candidatus Binatia bacterium]
MKIRRILAPTDFSDISDRCVEQAVVLARALGSEIVLLHAVEPVVLAGDLFGASAVVNVMDEIQRAARQGLALRVKRLQKKRGIRCRSVLVNGTAAAVIVDAAARLRADLIMMATHGRSGLSHLFLGSVAERVVRTSRCPVLTVPATNARVRKTARRRTQRPAA